MTDAISTPAQKRPGFSAIALAGGSLEPDFRRAGYAVANKAYLPVGGRLMIVRVLSALRAANNVSDIRVVTQPQLLDQVPGIRALCDAVVTPGPDLIGSVMAGLEGQSDERRVLVCATDLPLLTAQAIDAFADLADQTPCDVGYGFVSRSVHDQRYPGVRHTWVRLREGTFCGGGVSVMRAGAAKKIQAALRRFTDARKSPLKMAALFSPRLAFRLLRGGVSIAELEEQANRLTGLVCRGILCPFPEVAVNVDRLADLAEVERLCSK
jgi:GTP:adenosylcobinamide-phosphate guanylyltransferase